MSTGEQPLPSTATPVPPKPTRLWRRLAWFFLFATVTAAVLLQVTATGRLMFTQGVQTLRYSELRRNEQAAADDLQKRGVVVVKSLPEHDVNSINFCQLPLDDAAAKDIAALYRLQVANLWKTGIRDEQLRCVSGLAWLTSLALGETDIGDAGLVYLENLPSLEGLNLPSTKVSNAGLPHLARLTNLKILDLSKTAVTDDGLPALVPLVELNYLLLIGDDISDAGLKHLEAIKSLRRLTVFKTKVTPAGVARLKQVLGASLVVDF